MTSLLLLDADLRPRAGWHLFARIQRVCARVSEREGGREREEERERERERERQRERERERETSGHIVADKIALLFSEAAAAIDGQWAIFVHNQKPAPRLLHAACVCVCV
jgi:hypothetical protein